MVMQISDYAGMARVAPERSPQQCGPATQSAQQGQQAAQDIVSQLDMLSGFPNEIYYDRQRYTDDLEGSGLFKLSIPEFSEALQLAKEDPEYAAAFFNELGPETTAAFFANYESLINGGDSNLSPFDDRWNISSDEGIALLQDFSAALGNASSVTNGCFDGPAFMRDLVGAPLVVNGNEVPFDPELAAILVGNGDFSPESAAELGAYVLLNDDPPGLEPVDHYPSHREALFTPYSSAPSGANNAWSEALRGVMGNQASSELLNVPGVAERLLDPNLGTSSVSGVPRVNEIPALVGAVLEQPIADLGKDPGDPAAMGAIEAILLGGKEYHGRVNDDAANAMGRLYMNFAPEILNAGEGASAFALARNTELGRYLADSGPLQAGDGSFALTAALGADGTPPINPATTGPDPLRPGERFDDWGEALAYATAQYRNEVEAHGPPTKDAPGGGTYPDINALALEIADIDGEFLTGTYGAEAIVATDIDNANAFRQDVINIITDYAGFAVGLGPVNGNAFSFGATAYNTHMESSILEHFFPTDNAKGVFAEKVPDQLQQLLAPQMLRIVDSSARSGAITLPADLLDPTTGGLRTPEEGADTDAFSESLAEFIRDTPALHEAVDLARAQLEERINALDMGQYRGGG